MPRVGLNPVCCMGLKQTYVIVGLDNIHGIIVAVLNRSHIDPMS